MNTKSEWLAKVAFKLPTQVEDLMYPRFSLEHRALALSLLHSHTPSHLAMKKTDTIRNIFICTEKETLHANAYVGVSAECRACLST